MRDAKKLTREVTTALDAQEGRYDIAEIVAALDCESIDDLDPDAFWSVVLAHPLPDEQPGEVFRRELSAAIATQRAGRDAIWSDGVVTVRARGVSRVNQELPQPTATLTVETALASVDLADDTDWEALWSAVVQLRSDAEAAAQSAAGRLETATAGLRRADLAATRARETRDHAVRAALDAGVPATQVAALAGLSEPMVYKLARQR